ncbi:MAG: hypothetical protein LBJ84_03565 [Oscillospiraceae bacterium]|jgi:hypothetical protein|nr:hypothetical protein [Oscillospiraceae bacterium]
MKEPNRAKTAKPQNRVARRVLLALVILCAAASAIYLVLRQSGSPGRIVYTPEMFYEPGETVFIGTAEEQDRYAAVGRGGAAALVKRIIVNELGEVTAVVPVENQFGEGATVADLNLTAIPISEGYANMYKHNGFSIDIYIFNSDGPPPARLIAVVPVDCQIRTLGTLGEEGVVGGWFDSPY